MERFQGQPGTVRRIPMQKAATQKETRVGIIGADTRASWAKVSHVPAINGLPGLKLAAVATRNEQSARARTTTQSGARDPVRRPKTGLNLPRRIRS
jgi:predicted homoserine dehydrogenase-like protein